MRSFQSPWWLGVALLACSGAAAETRPVRETPSEVETESAESQSAQAIVLRFELAEMPTELAATMKDLLGLESLDTANGLATLTDAALEDLLTTTFRQVFVDHGLEELDFYRPHEYPRLAYWENVVVQLPDFVPYDVDDRYDGYTYEEDEAALLRTLLLYRLSRDPEQLRSLFARHQQTLYRLVSPELYRSFGFERYVEGLLVSHAHITAHERYPAVMDELDRAIRRQDSQPLDYDDATNTGRFWSRTEQSIAVYQDLGLVPPELVPQSEDEVLPNPDIIWFSSFWLRRHREGNTEAVSEILRAIDAHYD